MEVTLGKMAYQTKQIRREGIQTAGYNSTSMVKENIPMVGIGGVAGPSLHVLEYKNMNLMNCDFGARFHPTFHRILLTFH